MRLASRKLDRVFHAVMDARAVSIPEPGAHGRVRDHGIPAGPSQAHHQGDDTQEHHAGNGAPRPRHGEEESGRGGGGSLCARGHRGVVDHDLGLSVGLAPVHGGIRHAQDGVGGAGVPGQCGQADGDAHLQGAVHRAADALGYDQGLLDGGLGEDDENSRRRSGEYCRSCAC